jgi:predicted metal-dependent HD superfamily phosphohydrolase
MTEKRTWVDLAAELYRVYRAPGRFYHGLDHITELFREFDIALAAGLVENEEAMRLAIWFHDYFQDHQEDEEKSAKKGYEAALELGYPETFARIVHRLILVTKHSDDLSYKPQTNDEMLMCDLDLVPLAADNFTERTGWVRAEYPNVPDEVFFPARKAILKAFLDRPSLYRTPFFRERYQEAAKANLEKATQ